MRWKPPVQTVCRSADALTFHTIRHTIRTGGFHSVQQSVLGKMLRCRGLPLFQFGTGNAALALLLHIGQSSLFFLLAQQFAQHFPLHGSPSIEKLVQKGFLERKGNKKTKVLLPTDKGKALITVMPEEIQSPEMTAACPDA